MKMIMKLPLLAIFCIGLMLPLTTRADSSPDCKNAAPTSARGSIQMEDRLRMCALIGIWDSTIVGNNRHGYPGQVVAWVDDSVTAVRAAIHNLDLLQCASLEPSALAKETVRLVARLSADDFGKGKSESFELASNATPCDKADASGNERLVTFTAGSTPGYFQSSFCAFDDLQLPDDFVVMAAGAYSGRKTGFQIDQSGSEGTQIDVAVHQEKPVVLMLGAYEPTIWNIVWTPDTRIIAVLASGYHRQIIAGLKGNVPTLISSYDNHGACGYFYIGGESQPASLDSMARRLFNHPVDRIYPARDGKVLVGKSIPAGMKLVTSSSASPESFHDSNAPMAGKAGLEEAVEKGLLRQATQEDEEAWAKAEGGSAHKPVHSQDRMGYLLPLQFRLSSSYVVLKPFTFPAGLYGSNSATFYIPKGVSKPKGDPGHSVIYDFNTLD